MSDSFDQFPPFKSALIADFEFRPQRYEVWQNGQKVESGKTTSTIQADVRGRLNQGAADILINAEPAVSIIHMRKNSVYDICITAGDRLQLLTIPKEENQNECVGLAMCRTNLGATRDKKDFAADEPYCCNLFLKNGRIEKITFSLNHPEKLIEYYK